MRRRDVEAEYVDERGESGRLPLREVEDESRQRRRIDDRVLERALQAAPDEPGVKRVVAVLDQHRAMRETQECPARVLELGCADQHRSLDVVTSARVWVDGCSAVDERVEERKRAVELEPLGADFQDEERRVAGGLDVEGHELGFVERGLRPELGGIDGDFLPRHGLYRAARLE